MLSEAVSFPRADDDWLKTVLIGGVLSVLGVLVIPAIVVNGYLLRVARAGVEGDPMPPRFEEWVDLFVDGLLVWIVQFVYVGIPTLILVVLLGSFAVITSVTTSTGAAPGPSAGAVGGLVGLAILLVVGLLFLAAVYLMPAALANFARTGEFTAAFHLRTVAGAAITADYFVAMVLAIAVSVVLGFIGGLLTIILVGIFVLFYLQVVVYHLFGQGFARGLGLEPTAASTTEPVD